MAADVEDCWGGLFEVLGDVEIGGYVEAGLGLEVEVFYCELFVVGFACYYGLEVGSFREWVEAEHFEELGFVCLAFCFPVVEGSYVGEGGLGELRGLGAKVCVELFVGGGGAYCCPAGGEGLGGG